MPQRFFASLTVMIAVTLTIPAQSQDRLQSSNDEFSESLRRLQQRLEAVEAQNAKLLSERNAHSELTEKTNVETWQTSFVEGAVKDQGLEESPPESLEDLLQASKDANERLSRIEEELRQSAETAEQKKQKEATRKKAWFEKYTIRGYAQFRVNDVLNNDGLADPHHVGDSSIGPDQSFIIRRARLILSGDISPRVSLYFQPDFASSVPNSSDSNQFTQIRDLYADVALDDAKELRFRIGQSKVPYGWENLQSSSNRLPLDRSDSLNSAVRNERDLGVFCYWTPTEVQEIFQYIADNGLKGSGNYGMAGFGAYNGQGGSLREQNDNLHVVARFTYPFWLNKHQIVEFGMQGYSGDYTVLTSSISPLGVGAPVAPDSPSSGLRDERLAWTFVYYPQPLGFQSEWTVGRGPTLNDAQTQVEVAALYGGYAMVMYRQELEQGELIPFARWNYYKGGYKSQRNAPDSLIEEWEFGVEWQFSKALELVTMYTITDRTNTRAIGRTNTRSYEQFDGDLLRFQVQVNY